ncbi:UPF0223 family protein [Schleiferilactobacillus harbinensis]|uniref:UPF0223 family protein n=1 Tax=Schleiferilactobacillus harbinensis TaxID=304207 RepID=UPI0021A65C2E|nr:UPF0223 family protein [Schleiferilactobacillus harbinensis]MCT2909630.1 UPF0223 family protein [Schleiferilactobacillus harbinensis]
MTKATHEYSYPLRSEWSTAEVTTVMAFYNAVEEAYEGGTATADLLDAYAAFKTVVPDKMTEKQLDVAFTEASGYSLYRAVQAAKQAAGPTVQLTGGEQRG